MLVGHNQVWNEYKDSSNWQIKLTGSRGHVHGMSSKNEGDFYGCLQATAAPSFYLF